MILIYKNFILKLIVFHHSKSNLLISLFLPGLYTNDSERLNLKFPSIIHFE